MNRLLLRNGRLVDPANQMDATQDLLICDGKINRIAEQIEVSADETIDATGLIVT